MLIHGLTCPCYARITILEMKTCHNLILHLITHIFLTFLFHHWQLVSQHCLQCVWSSFEPLMLVTSLSPSSSITGSLNTIHSVHGVLAQAFNAGCISLTFLFHCWQLVPQCCLQCAWSLLKPSTLVTSLSFLFHHWQLVLQCCLQCMWTLLGPLMFNADCLPFSPSANHQEAMPYCAALHGVLQLSQCDRTISPCADVAQ